MKNYFGELLLDWYNPEDRPLPWKFEKDPYKIWLSEIILQQTRAEQAKPYYNKFITKYPTVTDLSKIHIDEMLSDWQGLGYYSRARNLHHAANTIVNDFDGVFPSEYSSILSLKGVGKYSAAAISSFAFNLPYPVIDGNVKRVLARYFDIHNPVDKKEGQAIIEAMSQDVFIPKKAALFNQAIMDFGASICKPKPLCSKCPLVQHCLAKQNNTQNLLPIKAKKIKRKKRFFNFLFIRKEDMILIEKRTAKDIWNGLYQLPLVETSMEVDHSEINKIAFEAFELIDVIERDYSKKQLLTHQEINSIFWKSNLNTETNFSDDSIWIREEQIPNYGFPKSIVSYFEEKGFIKE